MKILLLNPPFLPRYSRQSRSPCVTKGGTLYMPYSLAYATGNLEKHGFQVRLVDAVANGWEERETLEFVRQYKPDLAILDTSTPSIYSDVSIASKIKDIGVGHVSLVGTHPTRLSEQTLNLSNKIDSICRGEYDDTVVELAKAIESGRPLKNVKGITFRSGPKTVRNTDRPLIKDLDSLPFVSEVYKKHLDIKKYFYATLRWPQVTILTARGCPYSCSFCNIPFKSSYRYRSPENVAQEFEYIQNELPYVKEVMLEDDTFPVIKERTEKICKLLIEKEIRLKWSCNARVNTDFKTLNRMKEANCRLLCTPPNTIIFTESGYKPISDIRVGEKVLTDSGKLRRVTHVLSRKYKGNLIKIKPLYTQPLYLTPNHPVLFIRRKKLFCKRVTGICNPEHRLTRCLKCKRKKFKNPIKLAEWTDAKDLSDGFLLLPIPLKTSNQKYFQISKILSEYPLRVIDYQKILAMRKNGMKIEDIAKKINFPKSSVAKYFNKNYRTSIDKIRDLNTTMVSFPCEHGFVKNNIKIDKNFSLLCGYFAAEGSVLFSEKKNMHRTTFSFNVKEKKYSDEVCKLLNEVFGIKPTLCIDKKRHKREIISHSKTLTVLFRKLFGSSSIKRKIPDFFFYMPYNNQLAFLCGLLRGDGSPKKHKYKEGIERIAYTTNSENLFLSVYMMLLRVGVVPATTTSHHRKNKTYVINIDGYRDLKILKGIFNKPIYVGKFNHKRGFSCKNYVILPIRNLEEEKYSGVVKNLEVEHDESYTANTICVHNCVGFETPKQNVLDNINKKTTRQLQLEFMGNARKAGLLVNGCFILGLPGDTKETIRETIEFAKELNPDTAQFYPLMVYPGTDAYKWAKNSGCLETEDYSKWITKEGMHNTTVSRQDLPAEELVKLCDSARSEYYLRRKYILSKMAQIIANPSEFMRTVKSFRTFSKHVISKR